MRLKLLCPNCGRELSGGLDTFGESGCELCWDCWSDLALEATADPYLDLRQLTAQEFVEAIEREVDDERG